MKKIHLILFLFCVIPASCFAQSIKGPLNRNINISIKGTDIYRDSVFIGHYKKIMIDTDLISIVVFSRGQARIAEATHADNDPQWDIVTPVDQKKMTCPYNKTKTLENLFLFLITTNYL